MAEKTIGLVPVFDKDYEALSFPKGTTILMNDSFPSKGKLLKWKANFVKYNIVRLQVWRPVAGSQTEFTNVYDQAVDCESSEVGLGDVEITAKGGVEVEANDRIGVSVQEGTLGIAYTPIPLEKYLTKEFDRNVSDKAFPFETTEFKVKLFLTATYKEE